MRSRCFIQHLSIVQGILVQGILVQGLLAQVLLVPVLLLAADLSVKIAAADTLSQAELTLSGLSVSGLSVHGPANGSMHVLGGHVLGGHVLGGRVLGGVTRQGLTVNASSARDFDAIPTVRVSGKIRNVGHIDARFTSRRNKTWTSYVERDGRRYLDTVTPLLLRGRIAVGGGTVQKGRRVYATGASVIKNQLKITFPGRVSGSRKSRQRIYTVRVLLDGSIRVSARVSSVPSRAFHKGACGAAVGAASAGGSAAGNSTSVEENTIPPLAVETTPTGGEGVGGEAVMTRVVTISTDADPEWYAKYGESSNAIIASIINTAEAMYDRQLGLRFRIVRQHTYSGTSPYTSNDPGALLRLFANNSANRDNLGNGASSFDEDVDIKHLFTGKDMDGSVIGIAYIGTLCASPSLAYGITQAYVDAATPGIFAHELGHNFGAFHDVSDRSGIMYPSISIPPAERFSDFSLGEITQHLSRNSGCISRELMNPRDDTPGGPTPLPTPEIPEDGSPAKISLARRSAGGRYASVTRLSGRVTSAAGSPVGALRLNLMAKGVTVGSVVTDDKGRYQFLVNFSLPRGKMIYVYVETVDGSLSSRFMWIGRA